MLPATQPAKAISLLLLVLVIVGALNWLLVGAFKFDLVVFVTGGKQPKTEYNAGSRALYIAVGAAAVALVGVIAARMMM